ncbi:hypothetical protein D3I60_01410, partial [Brevibacterium permense]|nr:hypothetical protein [Brevibacterium permense]
MLGTSGSVNSHKVMKSSQLSRKIYTRNMSVVIWLFVTIIAAGGWYVFKFPGTTYDPGTWYDKFRWQMDMRHADDLMSQGKYQDAAK